MAHCKAKSPPLPMANTRLFSLKDLLFVNRNDCSLDSSTTINQQMLFQVTQIEFN